MVRPETIERNLVTTPVVLDLIQSALSVLFGPPIQTAGVEAPTGHILLQMEARLASNVATTESKQVGGYSSSSTTNTMSV